MTALEEANAAARATCARLREGFDLQLPNLPDWSLPVPVPVGLEIEVPWRSYFPQLWREYGLDHRRFGQLEATEALELSRRCAQLEVSLRPRLDQTTACGVPRGNDRYWEFALAPAGDLALLAYQVRLLTASGTLPRDRRHSLQITIGDLAPSANVYYLLMALELQHVDPRRIRAGVTAAEGGPIFTGWLRKGRAGVHRKEGEELALGSRVACELRTLQLPEGDVEFRQLLHTLAWGLEGMSPFGARPAKESWQRYVAHARQALASHGLPAGNWAGAAPSVWHDFASAMPHLRDALRPHMLRWMPDNEAADCRDEGLGRALPERYRQGGA